MENEILHGEPSGVNTNEPVKKVGGVFPAANPDFDLDQISAESALIEMENQTDLHPELHYLTEGFESMDELIMEWGDDWTYWSDLQMDIFFKTMRGSTRKAI